MVDWLDFADPMFIVKVVDGIQFIALMIAVIVGWKGFRMAERDAMELIKVCGENRRLKAEIAELKFELELAKQ